MQMCMARIKSKSVPLLRTPCSHWLPATSSSMRIVCRAVDGVVCTSVPLRYRATRFNCDVPQHQEDIVRSIYGSPSDVIKATISDFQQYSIELIAPEAATTCVDAPCSRCGHIPCRTLSRQTFQATRPAASGA